MQKIIKIANGTGEGLTELAAFDKALQDAGISNYNLIPLSSVIPPGFIPKIEKPATNHDEFGHKLYVVMAEDRTSEVGKEVWAGIGWVMLSPEVLEGRNPESVEGENSNGGLFVEHHAGSKEELIKLITDSLNSMKAHRSEQYGEIQYQIAGTRCADKPVCALVIAVYKSEGWE